MREKTVTMTDGQGFEWTNPHSWLRIMVQDPATGKTCNGCSNRLARAADTCCWTQDSLKPGRQGHRDHASAEDGSAGGGLLTATLPTGKTVGNGGLRPDSERSSRNPGGQRRAYR